MKADHLVGASTLLVSVRPGQTSLVDESFKDHYDTLTEVTYGGHSET